MPFRVIIAAEQQGIVKAVCAIMRLLSMSTVITLTTTAMETLTEHLHEHDTNLLILGFPRSSARSVIHQARRSRPGMRVLDLCTGSGCLLLSYVDRRESWLSL